MKNKEKKRGKKWRILKRCKKRSEGRAEREEERGGLKAKKGPQRAVQR